MTTLIAYALLAVQDRPVHQNKPVAQTAQPLTMAEFAEVSQTVDKTLAKVLKIAAPAPLTSAPGVATRSAIVSRFHVWFLAAKPKFRFTPKLATIDEQSWTLKDAKLTELARWGFVGRLAPLATSKAAGMTPAEFGDTLGFFLSRVADLTHTPTSKYSPYMQPPP